MLSVEERVRNSVRDVIIRVCGSNPESGNRNREQGQAECETVLEADGPPSKPANAGEQNQRDQRNELKQCRREKSFVRFFLELAVMFLPLFIIGCVSPYGFHLFCPALRADFQLIAERVSTFLTGPHGDCFRSSSRNTGRHHVEIFVPAEILPVHDEGHNRWGKSVPSHLQISLPVEAYSLQGTASSFPGLSL